MRILSLSLLIAIFAIPVFAQTTPERRMIEVTGSAETLVTPNEFTFKITLVERVENKQKITIDTLETGLRSELAAAGVDVAKDLTVFDLGTTAFLRKKTRDTLASKNYRLKLRELDKVEKLLEIADKLNITTLDLIDTTHGDIVALRKETKMEAIKAAKAKAQYMLSAIGETLGGAIFIKEVEDETPGLFYPSSNSSNMTSNGRSVVGGADDQQTSDALSFAKIKLRYEVLARFEIK